MPTFAPGGDSPQILHVKTAVFDLAQAAGSYTLFTASSGDIWIEIEQAFVKTAGSGFTSCSIDANHGTPKVVVASIVAASVTLELVMTLVSTKFVLPSTKVIRGNIVGTTGTAGQILLIVKWAPITPGAVLI